jgi:hypothetical protein
MKQIATRELWAKQSLLLNWGQANLNHLEYIRAAGRELMRRTDTSPGRRSREAYQQSVRRAKIAHSKR